MKAYNGNGICRGSFQLLLFTFIIVIAKPRPLQRTLTAQGCLPYLYLNNDQLYSFAYRQMIQKKTKDLYTVT
jgi:hypothetical protein